MTPSQLRALGTALEKIALVRVTESLKSDRRASQRLPFRQIICVYPTDGVTAHDEWLPMMSFDVSAIGLGVYAAAPGLAVGTTLVVDCVPHRKEEIYMPARVVRLQEPIPNFVELGIQFTFQPDLLVGVHHDTRESR